MPRSGVSRGRSRTDWRALLWVVPALAVYAAFVLFPLLQSLQYSFYDWDGIGTATWAGFDNWASLFTNPELLHAIANAFVLILFYTLIPIVLGLIAAALVRQVRPGPFGTVTRVALFVPQVIPLVAAGIAWSWLYSQSGLVNQFLSAMGLGSLARAWLGDFTFALPAVGVIGVWVMLGFCTVLLLSGMGKIDPSLYEAARLDGAGSVAEFFAVTLPGLRQELVVCVTFTMIAALTSFDIIQVSTQGGPGYQTLVPGVAVYRLAFLDQNIGQASALAIFLTLMVLAIIIPVQQLRRVR
ncbi:MAG TPA: sugar ABC transporter permease [Galbitalea sp.]|nr:sugar ABC transporter permease [Galbitalea sp.]